jgi:hypothetical protein
MSELTSSNRISQDRRTFLKRSTVLSAVLGVVGEMLLPMPAAAASDSPGLDIVGPKSGYSPQVGTLVSMLTWMREANGVISATKGLTQADLFVFIPKSFSVRQMETCCAPTGLDDTPPATMHIAGQVFYFYGPGGGGVNYPDQYLMEMNGKILSIEFGGPCEGLQIAYRRDEAT